ncbi:hypothetical protein V2J09_006335, partial [Rumex salicifolius]
HSHLSILDAIDAPLRALRPITQSSGRLTEYETEIGINMKPSSIQIDIAASTQKLPVDNRLSLRIYYRIADNLLRQAAIFRNEKNVIDLYIMLLRFSGLVNETIPRHRDYRASPPSKINSLQRQLLNAINESEQLKPAVRKRIEELKRKHEYEVKPRRESEHITTINSIEWPATNKQPMTNNQLLKASWPSSSNIAYEDSKNMRQLHMLPPNEQFQRLSLTIPRPKDETLSRHSILGPNGLRPQWQPPVRDKGVYYPNNFDVTLIEISRIQAIEDVPPVENGPNSSASDLSCLESGLCQENYGQRPISTEPRAMISFEQMESLDTTIVKQPSPPPVLADVQDLIPIDPFPIAEVQDLNEPLPDTLVSSESPMELHISTRMMDAFLRMARSNTVKDLETCGILAGSLKNRKFYVTALIIPKQEGTANSCQATNEEEIFEVQDKQSLFPLGWIHTHPTQSCFMSSIDVHTHYSYQVMLPEAVAIVMAPRDSSKKHGIFRLTTPGGMSVIRHCNRRGFHSHDPPVDGGPIYKQSTDVYMDPDLRFDVIDLR